MSIKHVARLGDLRLTSLQAQHGLRQLIIQSANGVTHGRLALVQGFGGGGIGARVDDGFKGQPLVERNFGVLHAGELYLRIRYIKRIISSN